MSQFSGMPQENPPNPFASSPFDKPPPPRRSRVWLWILLGALGMGALVCCGCAGLMGFAWTQVGAPLQAQLKADPKAQEHLGTVNSATLDMSGVMEAAKDAKPGEPPVMVFQVRGDKGSGVVHARQEGQNYRDAKLILPTGEEIELGF